MNFSYYLYLIDFYFRLSKNFVKITNNVKVTDETEEEKTD